MVSTVVVVPQDTVEAHIDAIGKAAIGDAVSASRTRADCGEAKRILGERHKFYRAKTAFYVQADSLAELNRRTNQARSTLLNYHFRAIAVKDDVKALDNFLLNLPMVYDPDQDRQEGWRQAQLTVTQHIAGLVDDAHLQQRQGPTLHRRDGPPGEMALVNGIDVPLSINRPLGADTDGIARGVLHRAPREWLHPISPHMSETWPTLTTTTIYMGTPVGWPRVAQDRSRPATNRTSPWRSWRTSAIGRDSSLPAWLP